MSASVSAWSAKRQISPTAGARPRGINASKPGYMCRSRTDCAHCCAITGLTGKPSRAWRIASVNRSANGSAPKRSDKATQPDTWPGTVTLSQPRAGIASSPLKRPGFQAAGARPDALSPCKRPSAHTCANASPPIPFMTGSITVCVMAAASAASMALPPRAKAAAPACAARGCEVAMTLRARTGWRLLAAEGVQCMGCPEWGWAMVSRADMILASPRHCLPTPC